MKTFNLAGKTFTYNTPIEEIEKALPEWASKAIKQRRREALRLAYDWHLYDWKTVDPQKLASSLEVPIEDVEAMKKKIAREARDWANEDYTQSDEDIAERRKVTSKTVEHYRQFYDKNYDVNKNLKKKNCVTTIRMRTDMDEAVEYQAQKTGYAPTTYMRLIIMAHLAYYPSYPNSSEHPDFIDQKELAEFRKNLLKL